MSRVLLVTHEASRSGAPRVAQLVAGCLMEQGHDVRMVSRRAGPLMAEFRAIAPTRMEPLWRVRRRLWDLPGAWGRAIARVFDMGCALATLLLARPDLVYVNSSSAAIYIRPARLLRLPVVLHFHESAEVFGPFLEQAAIAVMPAGIALVACSPSVGGDLERLHAGKPVALLPSIPDGARVLTLSSEPPGRDYTPQEFVVGCCGRVEHRKGADLWVEAYRRVRQALPELPLRFLWVGEGAPPEGAEKIEGIEFLGPSDNPYAHMRHFTVATLPSRDDPFPLVVMEAMLLGRPIVAFAVGGVSDQIGDAGILVPPGDVEGFASAIVDLLSDEVKRLELGERAMRRAQREFSREAFAARLAAIVEGALGTAARCADAGAIKEEAQA